MKMLLRSLAIVGAAAAIIALFGEPGFVQHAHAAHAEIYTAAFAIAGLRRTAHGGVLATGAPVGLWHYYTNDDSATVEAADYFNAAYEYLSADDIIVCSLDSDGTKKLKNYIVTASSSVAVTVSAEVGAPVALASAQKAARQRLAFAMNLADIAAGDLVTNYVPGFAGKILSIEAFALKAATTAAKAATVTPKVNATNVTGGALALTSANMTPQGNKVNGAAITAANTFAATDTIGLVASAVTAFLEGVVLIVVDLENTDLVNALQA